MGLIGYQGEPGAYSDEAVRMLFPEVQAVGFRTFSQTFDALQAEAVRRALLPVENTLGGTVQEVNDLLWERSGVRCIGEYVHPIRHCLLTTSKDRITRALSHPQALSQVRRYLESRGIEPVPYYDTAGAARFVAGQDEPGVAAVASAAAGQRYGLSVIARDIQDDDTNRTRFLMLERGPPKRPGQGASGDKTSLCFAGAHAPGSLVGALQCFSERNVNLTRLEARPIPEMPFEYRFFLDFQVEDPLTAEAALGCLENVAHEVRLFGTYGRLSPVLPGGQG